MAYMVRVIHGQEQDGEGCINRYYYWFNGSSANALQEVAQQFAAWVVPVLRTAQIAGCVNKFVKVEQVTSPQNKYILNLGNAGGSAGSANGLPNQNSMKVSFNVFPSSVTAPSKGGKAYAGLGNSSQAWGDLTPAVLAALQNVAVIIGSVLTASDGTLIFPMVVRMIDWENFYYIASSIIGAAAKAKVGSQDSRQGNASALSYLSQFDTFNDEVDYVNGGYEEWFTNNPIQINLAYLQQNNINGAMCDSNGERLLGF